MLTLIMIATLVPALAGVSYYTMRNRRPRFMDDVRGIALQTVIVIVVLLAIAGAVAGVLLSRGDEAVANLEAEEIGEKPAAASITSQALCERYEYEWNAEDGLCEEGDE